MNVKKKKFRNNKNLNKGESKDLYKIIINKMKISKKNNRYF